MKELRALSGGRGQVEQAKAVRAYTEQEVREGGLTESPWEGLVGGVILGSQEYAQALLRHRKRQHREEPSEARKLAVAPASWEQIVKAVERAKGESWEKFSQRHGDWGRDAVLWLGRHAGRMPLGQLAALVGGCDYTTVAKGVSRFALRMAKDAKFAQDFQEIRNELSNF